MVFPALPRTARGAPRVPLRRLLSSSAVLCAPAPLDTARLAARLQDAGVSGAQADSLAAAVRDAVAQSLETVERDLVSRPDAEKWRFARKTDFAQLKSEMQLLEHNDFAVMKTAHERLMSDIERVKVKLREDITRTQAGVRLDLNLEKGTPRATASLSPPHASVHGLGHTTAMPY